MSRALFVAALGCLSLLLPHSDAAADDWPRFRGPDGLGISAEKDLLQKWPDGGPKKLWVVNGCGQGFSAPSVANGKIYVTGMEGGTGYLHCFDTAGKRLWKVEYGREWTGDFPGARTTPAIDDGKVYVMSGQGIAACLDAETGKVVWSVDTAQKFGARNIQWGISESPLVLSDGVIVTPGGGTSCVVKLDKATGKPKWATRGLPDKSAYCSPGIVKQSKSGKGGVIVTMVERAIVGIDRARGTVLWKVPHKNTYSVHANTPLLTRSGILFCNSGYGLGSVALRLSRTGRQAQVLWQKKVMDNHFGGNVVMGDLVYGTSSNRPKARMLCLNAKTGDVIAENRVIGKGQVIAAGKRLYCYGENGVFALLDEKLREQGQMRIEDGDGQHWAHPAISSGVLYVRHGGALMAYAIK